MTLDALLAGPVRVVNVGLESFARDLAAMPSLRVRRARVLDMFPHTAHYEAVVLLERS